MDTPTTMPPSMNTPATMKSPKVGLVVLVVVLAVVAAGVGGVLAQRHFTLSPEQVITKSMEQLRTVETVSYHGDLSVETRTERKVPSFSTLESGSAANRTVTNTTTVKATFDGMSDMRDHATSKNAFSTSVTVQPDPSVSISFAFDVKSISKVLYAKVNTVPTLGIIDLGFLKDQWITLDFKHIQDQLSETGLTSVTSTKYPTELSTDQITQLRQAFFDAHALQITNTLPGETIDGVQTYHYAYTIDPKLLSEYLVTATAIAENRVLAEQEKIDLRKTADSIESLRGEMWIGTTDFLPRKWTFVAGIKNLEKEIVDGQLSLTLLLSSYNASVAIEVPSNSVTVEQLMSKMFEGLGGGSGSMYGSDVSEPDPILGTYPASTGTKLMNTPVSNAHSRDVKRISDLKQLQTALELYYNDQNQYPLAITPIVLGRPNTICLSNPTPPKSGNFTTAGCTTPVMGTVPADPLLGSSYVYASDPRGTTYTITANLEGSIYGFSGRIQATPKGIIDGVKGIDLQ